MTVYSGTCVRGPWDGKRLVNSSKSKPLLVYTLDYGPKVIGEYRLNDFGQWYWWETDEGRAIRILEDDQ